MSRRRCASGLTSAAQVSPKCLDREWEYGGYERQLDLPSGYGSGLEASLHNGQLSFRVLRGTPNERIRITLR